MGHSFASPLAGPSLLLAALAVAVGGADADARDRASAASRLDLAFLAGRGPLPRPLDLSAFTPSGDFEPGRTLEGVLHVAPIPGAGGLRTVVGRRASGSEAAQLALPPAISIGLLSDGDTLIPVARGALAPAASHWEWIFEPGRSWTDPADGGWSRASIPFALRERNANCTHNGVLTFVYDANGAVSRAAWEIASETCAYFKADIWGMAELRFDPRQMAGRERLIAAYRREVSARLPTREIERIGDMLPGVSPASFGSASEVALGNMTAYGLYAAGIHWVGGCATRHGRYPFCDVLDLPSYSLAKSLFAATALMRMELLSPGASRERIADHVPQCDAAQWAEVRLIDALDMATGLYASAEFEADEDSAAMLRFLAAERHDQRAALACTMFARRQAPGRRWVYHTSDTYLVGSALQRLLRIRNDSRADIYRDLVAEPIWHRLGLSPVLNETLRSYDAERQPLAGWGLTLHRDDVVRLVRFYLGGGKIDGVAVIDPALLAAALQRDPAAPGLPAGPALRYQHGFWAWDIGASIGCAHSVWVPFLSGYGGITVALFPNDVIYYYFSDGYEFAWARAARAANRIRPMCGS